MRSRRSVTILGAVALAGVAVAITTLTIAVLEERVGVPDGSSLYIVAVAAIAFGFGIPGAIVTAVAAVGIYDYFFTEPQYTLTVSDPGEWLNLVLLLFVAVTVGQLAALQRSRAEAAQERERESRALFAVSRALATHETAEAASPEIAAVVARDARLGGAWITFGSDTAAERVAGGTGPLPDPWPPRVYHVLHRPSEAAAVAWTRVRAPGGGSGPAGRGSAIRVRVESAGTPVGSIWGLVSSPSDLPGPSSTRLLRVAADLLSQALGQDELAEERRRAEVARQSDTLKSALLESVSHDLRTPLASIRAFAGTLMDAEISLDVDQARTSAASIDREAERLNRLVGNLLDLGRIEGGALRMSTEVLDLDDVVRRAVDQTESQRGSRSLVVAVDPMTTVQADPVLLEQALVNLLDNALRHGSPTAEVRVSARSIAGGQVRLTVEDSGPGVPDDALPRLFDRFYRAAGTRSWGGGTGIGLAVVRGFADAMGGRAGARRSELGGLAIDIDLPAAAPVVDEVATT